MTYSKRMISDVEPETPPITGVAGLQLLEELRRMLIPLTGDPDAPIQKVAVKRRFDVGS